MKLHLTTALLSLGTIAFAILIGNAVGNSIRDSQQEIMLTEDLGVYRGIQEMIKPCLTEESNGVYSLTMKQSAIIAVSCKNKDSYSIQWDNNQVKYTTTLINK